MDNKFHYIAPIFVSCTAKFYPTFLDENLKQQLIIIILLIKLFYLLTTKS